MSAVDDLTSDSSLSDMRLNRHHWRCAVPHCGREWTMFVSDEEMLQRVYDLTRTTFRLMSDIRIARQQAEITEHMAREHGALL